MSSFPLYLVPRLVKAGRDSPGTHVPSTGGCPFPFGIVLSPIRAEPVPVSFRIHPSV